MVHRGRETSRDREPLFPNRVSGHRRDGKIHLRQPLAFARDHTPVSAIIARQGHPQAIAPSEVGGELMSLNPDIAPSTHAPSEFAPMLEASLESGVAHEANQRLVARILQVDDRAFNRR